ncbi:MAG TPA: N-acetyltransferase family protein [Novosphingobium capsulatum]|nr:N-acetyltransferase family protein [Novosphingobium capsulatum]
MLIRNAGPADTPAILAIYNHAVKHTTAVWNATPATLADREAWLADKARRDFPVLVAEKDGAVRGYATYGEFRAFSGYAKTAEHSVYVDPACHRQGIGKALLEALVAHAGRAGLHVLVAGIDASNTGSIALHEALGFVVAGRLNEVGRKFDRWLDLLFLQKILEPPLS